MSLMQYLHMIIIYRVLDQLNIWHTLLTRYLHLIATYHLFDQSSNWHTLLTRYLQIFVSVLILVDVTIKLSKDIYKTRVLQKNRKGLLKLNWKVPKWMREKPYPGFDKYGTRLSSFGITLNIIGRRQVENVLRRSKQCIRLRLWSVLSPDPDMVNLELAEIIDIQDIHSLMNGLYRLIHVPMYLADVKGNVLLNVGWLDSRTKFHSSDPEARKHCIESDINPSMKICSGEFKLHKFMSNMCGIVAPVKVGGQQVGSIYAGHFFFEDEPVDYEFFRSQARQYGFNEKEYMTELEKVPRLSREAVDRAIDFLLTFGKLIDSKYMPCPIIWLMSYLKTTLFGSVEILNLMEIVSITFLILYSISLSFISLIGYRTFFT